MPLQDDVPVEPRPSRGSKVLVQLVLGFFLVLAFLDLVWLKFGGK